MIRTHVIIVSAILYLTSSVSAAKTNDIMTHAVERFRSDITSNKEMKSGTTTSTRFIGKAWKPNVYAPLCKPCSKIPSCPGINNFALMPDFVCDAMESSVQSAKTEMMKGDGCPWDETAGPVLCSALAVEAVKMCGDTAVVELQPHLTPITQQSCLTVGLKCNENIPTLPLLLSTCAAYPAETDPCEPCWSEKCPEASGAVIPRSKCKSFDAQVQMFDMMINGQPAKPDTCDWDSARKEICGQLFRDSILQCPNAAYNVATGAVLTKEGCNYLAQCNPANSNEDISETCDDLPPKDLDCSLCHVDSVTPPGGIIVPATTCGSLLTLTNNFFGNYGIADKEPTCPWTEAHKYLHGDILKEASAQCGAQSQADSIMWPQDLCVSFAQNCLDNTPDNIAEQCANGVPPIAPLTMESSLGPDRSASEPTTATTDRRAMVTRDTNINRDGANELISNANTRKDTREGHDNHAHASDTDTISNIMTFAASMIGSVIGAAVVIAGMAFKKKRDVERYDSIIAVNDRHDNTNNNV